jgi:putative ABC transport system permease protein
MNDIRYAVRQFRKSPLFTLIAIATLALGIGASTAIFTLLDQALIRSLPVSHPEQLVRLRYTGESPGHTNSFGGDDKNFFSYPMYRDLRDKNGVFNGLIATDEKYVGVQWNNRSEIVEAELVSGNYFEVLGLNPALGRLLLPSDDVANSNPVVVLSFSYWKTKLGSDPNVIGRPLLVNAQPFTIVGVAEPGFRSVVAGETPGLFVPASAKNIITPRWQDFEDRQSHWVTIVGRLKPGEKLQQAQAGLEPLWHAIRADELKQFGYHSPRTRRLFLDESHLQLLDGARGFSPLRDEIGRTAGADGLRQHLQPAAGARGRTNPGDGRALCDRRGPLADRPPVVAGGSAARRDRRRSRIVDGARSLRFSDPDFVHRSDE